jgi:RNA polymerase sigma-70 factor (ECF subfamily)
VNADDRRLIAECRNGRADAFGELVRRYQDRLYRTVYRLVDQAEDSRDIVQEAFLSAYQSLDRFKGNSEFFTWLYRIAVNAAISQKRKRRLPMRVLRGRDEERGPSEPLDPRAPGHPGLALEKAEDARRIQDALNQLSPEHRAVLVLKDMEEEKYESIAQILAVPIGTVRSRLHRARLELRALLQASEPGD